LKINDTFKLKNKFNNSEFNTIVKLKYNTHKNIVARKVLQKLKMPFFKRQFFEKSIFNTFSNIWH